MYICNVSDRYNSRYVADPPLEKLGSEVKNVQKRT